MTLHNNYKVQSPLNFTSISELVNYACYHSNDIEKIKLCCNYIDNTNYNLQNACYTLLSRSIEYCSSNEFIIKLIDNGISIDKNHDDDCPAPIITALNRGKNIIIMKLLDSNVNLNINFLSRVPILDALANIYISDDVIFKMIEKKAHINCKPGFFAERTIVSYAFLGNRSVEIYEKLLDNEFITSHDLTYITKVLNELISYYVKKR